MSKTVINLKGYKQTKIGMIPEDWEMANLGDVAKVVDCLHQTPTFSEEGFPMVRVSDIKPGNLNLETTLKVSKTVYEEFIRNYKPVQGDIVLSRVGSYGVSSFVNSDRDFCIGQNTVVIHFQKNSKYLYYTLNSEQMRKIIEEDSYGSGYKSLSLLKIKQLPIPLPPLPEQKKIAVILSTWDEAIEKLESLVALKEKRKKGLMQSLLTGKKRLKGFKTKSFQKTKIGMIPDDWIAMELKNLANIIRGSSPRPQGDPRFYGGTVPRLMGADVSRDGKYVTPKIDFLTEEGAKLSRPCSKGTLTIICSGDVGVPAFLAVDACIHDGFLALINLSSKVYSDYLYYIIFSMKNSMDRSATHGGIFTNLTTQILKDFEIPLPPFPEQKRIAEVLSATDNEINLHKEEIEKIKLQKKGLMQKLLTGQVRVNG